MVYAMVLRGAMILLLTGALGLAQKQAIEEANAKSLGLLGKSAPGFRLPDWDEKVFDLAEKRGDVVVLAFWATWCPPCRSEMPTFSELQKQLTGQHVAVVPVAFDDPAKARDFLKRKKLEIWSLLDQSGKVASLYGARALPRTFVIDRDGIVVRAFISKVSGPELHDAIEAARR